MISGFGTQRKLRFRWQFRRFFGEREVFRLQECVVFRIPNNLNGYRLGMTFKARASSVDRNKVRRQVRETFRQLEPFLGSFDYNVVIPQQKSISYVYALRLRDNLKHEFKSALRKSHP
ncbi:MAG: ribonuclease P protein component [Bacteriovoracia bacterium]